MQIIAISDSHENREAINLIRSSYPNADYLIHCGDSCASAIEVHGYITIEGNMDIPNLFPKYHILSCGPYRIMILHGHTLFGSIVVPRYLARYAEYYKCNVLRKSSKTLPWSCNCVFCRPPYSQHYLQ